MTKVRITIGLLILLQLVVLLVGAVNLSPTMAVSNYRPKFERAWVHPTNYGNRYAQDINGRSVYNQPLIVLHETVYSAKSAINYFQAPHYNEKNQVSYHTLIKLDGTIVYLIPPELRAFGAGNSVFNGPNGPETVKTDTKFPPSVNNFAYHVALETPASGRNRGRTHSGYRVTQYRSLAWLIAPSRIADNRITTHKAVDRSGSRIDPRSFDFKRFMKLLYSYRLEKGDGRNSANPTRWSNEAITVARWMAETD